VFEAVGRLVREPDVRARLATEAAKAAARCSSLRGALSEYAFLREAALAAGPETAP
jgi:hypothetical protein